MNVTELARQIRMNTTELLEILPQYGFDIGRKAIKIDDRMAEQVIRRWKYIKRELEEKKKKEQEENKLKERELRIAVAESCTGGGLADRITNVNGSSSYFERGVVTYSNAAKVELLKVDEDVMLKKGAVSTEVAMQMAEGIKSISGTDIGVSLTGIMGPTGAVADKPVGTVFIGYCDDKVCTAKRFQFGEDRILNKKRATQAALEMVRRSLLGISFEE